VVKVDCLQFSEALLKAVGRAALTVSASVTGPAVVVVADVLPAAAWVCPRSGCRVTGAERSRLPRLLR